MVLSDHFHNKNPINIGTYLNKRNLSASPFTAIISLFYLIGKYVFEQNWR